VLPRSAQDFNSADLGIFQIGSERDSNLPSSLHIHAFNIGLSKPPALAQMSKSLNSCSWTLKKKRAARPGHAGINLREMQFSLCIAVGNPKLYAVIEYRSERYSAASGVLVTGRRPTAYVCHPGKALVRQQTCPRHLNCSVTPTLIRTGGVTWPFGTGDGNWSRGGSCGAGTKERTIILGGGLLQPVIKTVRQDGKTACPLFASGRICCSS